MPIDVATRRNSVINSIKYCLRADGYSRFVDDARRGSDILTVLARVLNSMGAAVIFCKAGLLGSFLAVVLFTLATSFYAALSTAV